MIFPGGFWRVLKGTIEGVFSNSSNLFDFSLFPPWVGVAIKVWGERNASQPKPRLFTVGRLDVATTGLLIITNDGDLAQKVGHPSSGLTKECVTGLGFRIAGYPFLKD